MRLFIYSAGVVPANFLKYLKKLARELKPHFEAIALIVYFTRLGSFSSISLKAFTRNSFT